MASDTSPDPASPAGEERAAALAEEVRQLRALLVDLQAELKPSLQSSLRERSTELQRLGGELSERDDALAALKTELEASRRRAAELEQDVERWRDAARRGVEEIAAKAREAAERFERQTAELAQALAKERSRLEASRAQARSIAQARDAALREGERRRGRIEALKARILARESRKVRSLSWRITAPLRWLGRASHRLLLRGARMRKRLLRR